MSVGADTFTSTYVILRRQAAGRKCEKKKDIIRHNDLNAFPYVMITAVEAGWGGQVWIFWSNNADCIHQYPAAHT